MRFFLILFLSIPLWAQMRIIPHLTRPDGGFTSKVLVNNLSAASQDFTLLPYSAEGLSLEPIRGTLDGFQSMTLTSLGEGASHFFVDAEATIDVLVSYQDSAEMFSPAHAPTAHTASKRFRLFPGLWSDVIDGLAVVNNGDLPTDLTIIQRDANGANIGERLLAGSVPAHGKALVLLDQYFEESIGGYFDLEADQPLVITFLRFSRSCPYFWSSPPLALDDLPSKIGMTATLVGNGNYGISGTAEITDDQTITIQGFNYTGDGLVVKVYAGLGGDYGKGFAISDDLIRSTPYVNETIVCKLPPGKSLLDLDGISIWCVTAGVDFGSGTFQ